MKKLLLTSAIIMAMGTTTAFAHHPAEAYVPEDVYTMIDENVSDVHDEMTFDDEDNSPMDTDTNSGTEASTGAGADPSNGNNAADVGAEAVSFDVDGSSQAETRGDAVGGAKNQRR